MKDFIKIHEQDNVIVAIREIAAGETIVLDTEKQADGVQSTQPAAVRALETIPAGH